MSDTVKLTHATKKTVIHVSPETAAKMAAQDPGWKGGPKPAKAKKAPAAKAPAKKAPAKKAAASKPAAPTS